MAISVSIEKKTEKREFCRNQSLNRIVQWKKKTKKKKIKSSFTLKSFKQPMKKKKESWQSRIKLDSKMKNKWNTWQKQTDYGWISSSCQFTRLCTLCLRHSIKRNLATFGQPGRWFFIFVPLFCANSFGWTLLCWLVCVR